MTRRAARITHDEVRRMIKATQASGLPIARVVFNGDEVSLVIGGDSVDMTAANLDAERGPETFQTFEEYLAWRDGSGAGAD